MQTMSLPIQPSSASSSPVPSRPNSAPNADAGQFSQALTRQIEQRNNSQAAAPSSTPEPAQAPAQAAAGAPQPASKAGGADAAKDASTDSKDDTDAADAAAASPVADLLALVASFNLPPAKTVQQDAPAADPLTATRPGLPGTGGVATTLLAGDKPSKDALADSSKDQTASGSAPDAAAFKDMLPAARGDSAGRKAQTGADSTSAGAAEQKPVLKSEAVAAVGTARPGAADPSQLAQVRVHEGSEHVALKEPQPSAPLAAQVQQAALSVAPPVAASDRIGARVGTPAWDNQISQKIVWMVAGKEQSASLTLNPPDMGPMQVVLSVTNDQATVTFSSAQPEVRQALENAMPRLREMMGENGIALGNASVNAGMPDQRQAQGEQSRSGGAPGRFDHSAVSGGEAVLPRPARGTTGTGQGLVDTFA